MSLHICFPNKQNVYIKIVFVFDFFTEKATHQWKVVGFKAYLNVVTVYSTRYMYLISQHVFYKKKNRLFCGPLGSIILVRKAHCLCFYAWALTIPKLITCIHRSKQSRRCIFNTLRTRSIAVYFLLLIKLLES